MKSFTCVGVDVSKLTLGIDLHGKNIQIDNSVKGINILLKKLDKNIVSDETTALLIMEATGGYEKLLVEQCLKHNRFYHELQSNFVYG